MATSNLSGIVLLLVFVGLIFIALFLFFKRESLSFLGNKFLLYGVVVLAVIVFLFGRASMVEFFKSVFKEAPYNIADLKSIVFKYGVKDSLVNEYDSGTGEYQYLNRKDSLVKKQLYLTKNDLLYLHYKAVELGFWDFPINEVNADTTGAAGAKPPRFIVQFNYRQASKTVAFSVDYHGSEELVENNRALIQAIQTVLKDAEDRQKK